MQNSTAHPARPSLFSGLGRAFKLGGLFSRGPTAEGPQTQITRERAPGPSSDRRTLDAIALLNSAHGDAAIAHALAEALRLSTGTALAAVLLPVHNTRAFTLTAFSAEEDTLSLNILRGAVDTSVAARRAIEHGAATVIGESLPADALPAWARARKYASGLVAPVTLGDHTLAIVYALNQGTIPASVEQIKSAELLLSIAARHLGRPPAPTEPRKDAGTPTGAQPAAVSPARPPAMASTPVPTTQGRVAIGRPVVRTEAPQQPPVAATGPVSSTQSASAMPPAPATTPLPALTAPLVPVTAQAVPSIARAPLAPAAATPRPATTPTPIARFLPGRPAQRLPLTALGLNLDPDRESVEVLGIRISLSSTEFSLLHSLASAGQSPVTLGQLAHTCWDEAEAPSANAVEVALSRLKKKLARAPGGAGVIHTVRGQGYRLSMAAPPAVPTPKVADDGPTSPGHARQTAAAAD